MGWSSKNTFSLQSGDTFFFLGDILLGPTSLETVLEVRARF